MYAFICRGNQEASNPADAMAQTYTPQFTHPSQNGIPAEFTALSHTRLRRTEPRPGSRPDALHAGTDPQRSDHRRQQHASHPQQQHSTGASNTLVITSYRAVQLQSSYSSQRKVFLSLVFPYQDALTWEEEVLLGLVRYQLIAAIIKKNCI